MEWVETTGRTVAEALDAALDELGVDEDDVEYEVLEEPKTGLFGRLGGNEARIRARVKPISREKPGERQRRNRRPGGSPVRATARRQRRRATPAVAPARREAPRRATARLDRRPRTAARWRAGHRRRRRVGAAPAVGGGGGRGGSGGRTGRRRRPARAAADARHDGTARGTRGDTVDTIDTTFRSRSRPRAAEDFTRGLVDAFDLGRRGRRSRSTTTTSWSTVDGDEPRAARRAEGRDAARDRGAGAHGGAAPDRRSRRPDPRRRRRLPGQAPGGARDFTR